MSTCNICRIYLNLTVKEKLGLFNYKLAFVLAIFISLFAVQFCEYKAGNILSFMDNV